MDRREALQTIGGLTAVVGFAGCVEDAAPQSAQADIETREIAESETTSQWLMAGHDPRGSGYNPAVELTEPTEPAWSVTLDVERRPSECVIDDNRMYAGVSNYEEVPATTRIEARTLSDGTVEWSKSLPYSVVDPPAIGRGPDNEQTLFVASSQDHSNTGPGQGSVFAFDPTTGEELWEQPLGAKLGGIVVAEDAVVVTTTAINTIAVHVLDAATGEKRFSKESDRLHNTPTVYDGAVYFSSGREKLAAVSLSDGELLWETDTRADDTRPVVDWYRDLVYMGHRLGLEAFDRDTGEQVWNHVATEESTPREDWLGMRDEPVVMEDQLVVRTQDTSDFNVGDIGHCYGIDPKTGEKTWELPEGRPGSSIVGAGDHAVLRRGDSASSMDVRQFVETMDGTAGLVAVDTEGSLSWELRGQWRPVAVSDAGLVVYQESEDIVDIGFFEL